MQRNRRGWRSLMTCLLICCAPNEAAALIAALRAAGIAAAVIGELGKPGAGVAARKRGRPAPWPAFAADEAARLLGTQAHAETLRGPRGGAER